MEQANLLVNTHSAAIIIVLLLIVLVALGMCFSLQGRLNKLQKNMTSLLRVRKPILMSY